MKCGMERFQNLVLLKGLGCEASCERDSPETRNKDLYAEFFENCLINQEISGREVDLEEIQEQEDTSPSEITRHYSQEVEESDKWIDAMNAEMQSMIDNMVWVLVDLPPNCKTVGSKWLFKIKTDMDGNVHTYKARLVAKGYTQLYGVDYEETFSPVADIRAIRILISIAAFYDYEIWQMDVKTAFLNGHLDEDIYMVQPEGFVDPKHPRKVCKLQRSIYGLKQASRSWNKRFDEEIKRFGFTQNLDEPCVYQKASGSNVTFLILYVDDIIIMGNHIPSLQSVKDYLGKCFAMKDLGEAAFILGIKIYRDRSKRLIGLSQSAYMDKILKRYRMDNSKRGHIPMQERLDLNKTQGASTPEEVKRMQNVPYASAVGSIMYAVRCTRPDVAFAQNITSRFQQNPGEPHWTAVKTILKYLRNTKDMFLVYGGNPEAELRVECYCDAGFETDRDDTKSQTGYVFILNGGAVDSKSSKKSTTAMSATEVEYIAASEAAMEAIWIRKFISGLGIVPTINEPIKMFCDNSAALHFANEPGVQRGARHYHGRYHYVRKSIALGEIKLLKVYTDDNLADPFTKALPNGKLTQHAIIFYSLSYFVKSYEIIGFREAAKDIVGIVVKLLMKSTKLSYQEREWRLYNLFNKFASVQGEDPIDCINKAMTFLSVVVSRQTQSFAGTRNRGTATTSRGNYAVGQAKVVKCYNCLGEGHMAKQCTQPKRPRISAWFKEKLMLAETQEAGQILDEEQLAFIADPGIAEVQVAHQTIPQNSAFQTQDLDAYDSDCDDISSAKAVLMGVQEIPYYEQTHIVDFPDNEIT
ncbi:retrotransposon protein, putative, ty1-copia subclass [Tanacetum coccineum]|uniref:Retrotransposon protein, putative, ty1-copia subclass n=1 Tax=Tanacetum coccineum TaxID=301880 RepID=A0ABQ5H6C3_9ASTR